MEGSSRPQYQLRRVGKPASIVGVKDIMKLNADVTRFGRHSHNDYYLDSSQLAHFISRWHSEIHRVEQEGKTKYIIRDNSLNGTYVNDVRVSGNSVLQEGDIIIFGHTNGKNVKPGQRALQADSEFKFLFEKVTVPLNDSVVNSSFQESSLHNGVGSSHGSPPIPVQGSLQSGTNGVVLKDISNTNCSTGSGLVPIDSIITQQSQSEESGGLHTTLAADGGSDEDIFNSDDSDDDNIKSTSAITTGSTTILTTASAMRPVHTPPPPSKAELRGSSPTPKRGRPPKASPKSKAQPAAKVPAEPPNAATAASRKRKKSASAAATPPSQTNLRTKQKEKEKEKEKAAKEAAAQKNKRRRKGPFQKPAAAGGRRSKRHKSDASGESPSESHSDSEESAEEDYSYHYDGDTCEAYDCTRPVSDKVSWVQCDDCDRWYHTCCVGCSFEMVAQDNTQFHCGCK